MSQRALILIVFHCALLINGVNAAIFHVLTAKSVTQTEPKLLKPDTIKTTIDTLDVGDDTGIDSQIDYQAEDSIRLEPESKKVYLYGNAEVHYGDFNLKAAYIEIDNKTNLVTAVGIADSTGKTNGNPEIKDGLTEMTCEKIIYNTKTKKGKITGIMTKQADMFIHGEAVKKDTNNVMYIKNMKCIPCEFDDAKIYFRAGKAKVIPNDKIVTGPLFVEIMNIPTPLGLPFGYFPNVKNKSKAGILMPSYGQSQIQGFFLRNLGFFMPTGNNIQLLFYGDIYTNGSFALRPTASYKFNYKFSGNFGLSFSQFNTGVAENKTQHYNPDGSPIIDPTLFQHQRDFRVTWTHSQDNKNDPSVRFSATINAGTSDFNKYNNQTPGTYLNNTLASNIMYTKTLKNSSLTINARHNQNTITKDIQIDAPQLTYAVNRMFPFKNSAHTSQNCLDKLYVDYTLQGQSTIKTKDSILFKPTAVDLIQYGMNHRLPIGTNISLLKYFTLNPQANFTGFTYFETAEKKWNPLTRKVEEYKRREPAFAGDANFSANLTTKVYGDYVFRSKLVQQIRHQMIPSVGFIYHPDLQTTDVDYYRKVQTDTTGENFTTYSRFEKGIYGAPAGAESGAITFNLNNTVDAKVRQKTDTSISYKKVALLQMLSIGGSYDVAAKKNKLSIINVSGRTSLVKNIFQLMTNATFDPYALDSIRNRSANFQYDKDKQLARFTGMNFSINANFGNSQFKAMQNSAQPWNVTMNYNLNLIKSTNPTVTPDNKVQTLGFNFSLKPTAKWSFDVMTNYDFKAKTFSYTNISIHRDLHCWEAAITWVPFGFSKQYSVSINLKTAALRDIKIPKQKQWFDNI